MTHSGMLDMKVNAEWLYKYFDCNLKLKIETFITLKI